MLRRDIHDVFTLFDRVAVIKNSQSVRIALFGQISKDEALTMIILGTRPIGVEPKPGEDLRLPEQPKENKT